MSRFESNAAARADLWDDIRLQRLNHALGRVGLTLPSPTPHLVAGRPSLNKALQHTLSEFVRRTRIALPRFVELVRGQTHDDYRPNKRLLPDVLRSACQDYPHLDALITTASSGVRVPLAQGPPRQRSYPANHKSADDRYPVLVKNIRKGQDLWRCLVLDLDTLATWPEVHISPFGVVNKGNSDPRVSGRVIHDLSFPDGDSVNDATDVSGLCPPLFEPCDTVAREILTQQDRHPHADILLQAGDVASAFRNASTHSESAYLFGGRLEADNALFIDTAAAFGWSGSPASYGVVGGAIAHLHGRLINAQRSDSPFNYFWVGDHVNVAADVGSNCADVDRSLRFAMVTVLGHGAINEEKFTSWSSRRQVLYLVFDTVSGSVAMPPEKNMKAPGYVLAALTADFLRRSDYRSLLGRLRHVATCIRLARAFLQRLCQHERHISRWSRVPMSPMMKEDLSWWCAILESSSLNRVPLAYFRSNPPPDVVVEMDSSDVALCALVAADRCVLRYRFNAAECALIATTKSLPSTGFDINFRELLSCAFAVQAWGQVWSDRRANSGEGPVHVHFRIDNMSAVSWQNKLCSRNLQAQTIIRLLCHWEVTLGFRFSASHVAGLTDGGCHAAGTDLTYYLRAHSVADSTFAKYHRALTTWYSWSTAHGVQPALIGYSLDVQLHVITTFILHGFQVGYGSGRRIRSSTIASTLQGILHFFQAAGLQFPSSHSQVRMVLKDISRLDGPSRRKAPVSLQLLKSCFHLLDMSLPSDQALWGALCLAFFFLLRRSEITAKGMKFAWFALKASDIAVTDAAGSITHSVQDAAAVRIRLVGSKTNQQGAPTKRMLNRSNHPFLCPVFGALCTIKARAHLPVEIPAAVFINEKGSPACITGEAITSIIRRAASYLGENPQAFSAHSLRAGGATHMYRAGVDALTIQFHGRWASDTFKQYTRLCNESVEHLAAKIVSGPEQVQHLH